MKQVLQDKTQAELAEVVARAGEKSFRARQLGEGLMHGKRISEIPVTAIDRGALSVDYAAIGFAVQKHDRLHAPRSLRIVPFMSSERNTALPATMTFAPASSTSATLDG